MPAASGQWVPILLLPVHPVPPCRHDSMNRVCVALRCFLIVFFPQIGRLSSSPGPCGGICKSLLRDAAFLSGRLFCIGCRPMFHRLLLLSALGGQRADKDCPVPQGTEDVRLKNRAEDLPRSTNVGSRQISTSDTYSTCSST